MKFIGLPAAEKPDSAPCHFVRLEKLMNRSLSKIVIDAAIASFEYDKALVEKAIAQVPDSKMHEPLDSNTNSIVVIMKHISGNLKSRWTDFLTTDGEKEWRDRDTEFIDDFTSREQLMEFWEAGWSVLFDCLRDLSDDDLEKTVTIRGYQHSIPMAIHRSNAHIAYHIGQIVMMARIHCGDQWNTLTIEPGKSKEYNQTHWGNDSPTDA